VRNLLVLSVAFLTACAMFKNDPNAKIIPRADLQVLAEQFTAAIAKDSELASILGPFQPTGTKRPDTEPFGNIPVNQKAWGNLTPAQRDHVIKKAATTFSALFLKSPVSSVDTATVYLVEGRSDVGWFHVRASRGDYLYRLSGQ
jgi:hypothetical protein